LELIKRHVEENEIERPEDLWIRTVPNKSKPRIEIIQGIDRQIPLDELARSKCMEFADLIDEIESIVRSGTKINISYYLNQIMDEEDQEEVIDYFRETEDDDFDLALDEFGSVYSDEEIKLLKIKFLSEMGI